MNARFAEYEKQLKERQEECEYLLARKNAHANEYIERMAELRENHEKQLANKEDTIRFLRELSEKQQRDLEKAEAISSDYLHRIDEKNQQLLSAYAEIRQLNAEIMRMVNVNADDMKSMIDRFFRLTDAHTEEIRALTQK
jgi:Mn-containing catalase